MPEQTREEIKAGAPAGFTLAPAPLARPLNRDGAEDAAMRNLLGLLNDPAVTGPKPKGAELAAALSLPAGSPSPVSGPEPQLGRSAGPEQQMPNDLPTEHFADPAVSAPTLPAPSGVVADGGLSASQPGVPPAAEFVVSSPAVVVPPAPLNRILFTGRSLAGKDWLAGQIGGTIVSLNKLISQLAFFGFEGGASVDVGHEFVEPVRAWGDGIANDKFPLTPERWLFILKVQEIQADVFPGVDVPFGELGFWNAAFEQAMKHVKGRAVVTDCRDEAEYKALVHLGFSPYHVIVSNPTHAARKSAQREKPANQFSAALDSNVIKQISQQRHGKKLRVIWNDNVAPGSNRFLSVAEFIARTQVQSAAPEAPVNVTIAEEVL